MKADDKVYPYQAQDGYWQNGISARDHIAIEAMKGHLASWPRTSNGPGPEIVASKAYKYADAMIAESEKSHD